VADRFGFSRVAIEAACDEERPDILLEEFDRGRILIVGPGGHNCDRAHEGGTECDDEVTPHWHR
jgi:hypothetical protein